MRTVILSTLILSTPLAACCDDPRVSPSTAGIICGDSNGPDDSADCCDEHGSIPGKRDTCNISEEPFCVGCDGEPVLCWTVGCESTCDPNKPGDCVEDCCLSAKGETVPLSSHLCA